ncbi:hypothetical protein IRJ41_002856 [Triplophysa rosa]|uniref:Uncharacterized protein n=1 Tax=Triplophysa rosa TaxID=992332 RepID=A0A9W7WS84_TRIRA|nr:hypothetical protein IRJ41_002856 [Triplophysa rosa]
MLPTAIIRLPRAGTMVWSTPVLLLLKPLLLQVIALLTALASPSPSAAVLLLFQPFCSLTFSTDPVHTPGYKRWSLASAFIPWSQKYLRLKGQRCRKVKRCFSAES